MLRLLRLSHYHRYIDNSAGLVTEGLEKAKIHCVEYLLCARWRVMVAELESLGLSLVRH